ncbi:MAG: helix-turn-helix transcriptional regulator [Blautia hansenii]
MCSRETLTHKDLPWFLEICDLFKQLVPLYITQPPAMNLACEAIVMQILFKLVNHFSVSIPAEEVPAAGNQERLKEILLYVEEHYSHSISLEEISAHFGLNREYFCRFFKKNVGLNFSRHVNLVRLSHIHFELLTTNDPIMEIIDRNGFTNYKLFHKLFREIYGCTPRDLRTSKSAGAEN